ncbi:hypothetical protein JXB41_03400 [Candidatus Woesearchaeota archaeon]|nr:hypothetical protein [Candidatus Woesearchaeota archaeon]
MKKKKKEIRQIQKVGPACGSFSCPLCTKEGIFLVFLGLILTFVLPGNVSWLGLIIILFAYLIPVINKLKREKKWMKKKN